MRSRSGRWPILASGLLAISLLGAPGTLAAEPSADDPVATVNGLLDTLVAKDFAGIGAFVCAEKRDGVVTRFDLEAQFAALGEGVDVEALFAGITVTTPDRLVEVTVQDGTTATVSVTGSILLDISVDAARAFVAQVLEAEGMDVTEETLDQYTPMLIGQIEQPQDLTEEIAMVVEDGRWLVCDDFGGPGAPQESPTPSGPAASLAPMDAEAYASLLASIPEGVRSFCEPDGYWQVIDLGPEPGEIAQADCDPDGFGGSYVSYSLFDSQASMDAFYDQQLLGMRNLGALDGPGCPEGPGEATSEHGRRFCYQPFGDDANMRWTHDALAITASAADDDGDWARLETFFASAGPVAP